MGGGWRRRLEEEEEGKEEKEEEDDDETRRDDASTDYGITSGGTGGSNWADRIGRAGHESMGCHLVDTRQPQRAGRDRRADSTRRDGSGGRDIKARCIV